MGALLVIVSSIRIIAAETHSSTQHSKVAMRNSSLFLCLCLLASMSLSSGAQSVASTQAGGKVPSIIMSGLTELQNHGPDDAEKAWYKGSRWETAGDDSAAKQLRWYQEQDGQLQGFDVITVQDITPRTRVVYVALNYERGPEFAKFVVYRTGNGWILLLLHFNISEETFEPLLANRQ